MTDDIKRLRDALDREPGTTVNVSWATLIGILSAVLLSSLGYLFVVTSTLQTRVAVAEQSLVVAFQKMDTLVQADRDNAVVLREIRDDQIRRLRKEP